MKKILLTTACAAVAASSAMAAVQGGLGTTSTGSLDVSMQVAELVRVSNISDISLDNGSGNIYQAGGGALSGSTSLCVYYNNATDVNLTFTSANPDSGSFRMTDGTEFLTYVVNFSANGDDGVFEVAGITEGSTESITNADVAADDSCVTLTNETNAVEAVFGDTGTALGVANGTYTDTITIVAAPTP